jgi:5-methylcytosine-specific restriction endonuclease McrA
VMATFQTSTLRQFDGPDDMKRSYVVCDCGYPVWQMEWELYGPASDVMERNRRAWNRRQSLVKAGGKHTRAEILHIKDSQKGRCIYCHRLFTGELVPSKDHLLPLVAGGSDWALNIVLACRSCNSKRCDIPFRTYCTLLSPAQNK